mmetsp:Transcript_10601/g.24589  ORF Transcript_10601/g.24589 Transcript_10601/m.24589 type:complete len:133 (-) Transcript_10601:757-1155(-)
MQQTPASLTKRQECSWLERIPNSSKNMPAVCLVFLVLVLRCVGLFVGSSYMLCSPEVPNLLPLLQMMENSVLVGGLVTLVQADTIAQQTTTSNPTPSILSHSLRDYPSQIFPTPGSRNHLWAPPPRGMFILE